MTVDLSALKNKRVLITGNTGFKGSWLTTILDLYGAEVFGYSLDPPTYPNLFEIANLSSIAHTTIGDIRDFNHLLSTYKDICPDIVIHMAAQPLVRDGYIYPRETYEINIMGTANILECERIVSSAQSFLNVTTDKVYRNSELDHYFVEDEFLDGYDPYSNSKSCSELVTAAYKRSFFSAKCPISTARAGNVIGGGDFAKDRIIPDCIRSAINKQQIILRNPNSIRPYQHVLEPLFAYLNIVTAQIEDSNVAGSYNVGPNKTDCITTGELASLFCKHWGEGLSWITINDNGPHEANYLKLDSTKIKRNLGYSPRWSIENAIIKTVEFTKEWISNGSVLKCMQDQINEYRGAVNDVKR